MPVTEFTLRAIFEAEDRFSKSIQDVNEKLGELGESSLQLEQNLIERIERAALC